MRMSTASVRTNVVGDDALLILTAENKGCSMLSLAMPTDIAEYIKTAILEKQQNDIVKHKKDQNASDRQQTLKNIAQRLADSAKGDNSYRKVDAYQEYNLSDAELGMVDEFLYAICGRP